MLMIMLIQNHNTSERTIALRDNTRDIFMVESEKKIADELVLRREIEKNRERERGRAREKEKKELFHRLIFILILFSSVISISAVYIC